jgi:hypothetical protein
LATKNRFESNTKFDYTIKVRYPYIYIIFLYFFLFPFTSVAQGTSIPSQIPELKEQVSFVVTPELPKANQLIKIRAEAFGTDLTRSFITWKINGITKKTGRGEQTFELTNGSLGTAQNVSVIIEPFGGGENIEKTFSFLPQEVDILWEARSYTPPFYKGKALPGYVGNVVALAVPHFVSKTGTKTTAMNPTYKWKQNYSFVAGQSGFQKNTFKLQGGYLLQPETLQVEVRDDLLNRAISETRINFFNPLILFYENNPLYGILNNKALTEKTLTGKEISLSSTPFFFDLVSNKKNDLDYAWTINGEDSFLFRKNTALFRYDGDEEGSSRINITAKNPENLLQEAVQQLTIQLKQ